MASIERPETFLRPNDHRMVRVSLAIALAFLITIPALPYSYLPLNFWLQEVIPLPVALLFLVAPFAMYAAISVNQQVKFNDYVKRRNREAETKTYGKVLFLAQMRGNAEGGTEWRVRNANGFDWTNCRLMLELRQGADTDTETHELGTVKGQAEVRIQSKLPMSDQTQWRVMVITDQGRLIDFPDHWLEMNSTLQVPGQASCDNEEPGLTRHKVELSA